MSNPLIQKIIKELGEDRSLELFSYLHIIGSHAQAHFASNALRPVETRLLKPIFSSTFSPYPHLTALELLDTIPKPIADGFKRQLGIHHTNQIFHVSNEAILRACHDLLGMYMQRKLQEGAGVGIEALPSDVDISILGCSIFGKHFMLPSF